MSSDNSEVITVTLPDGNTIYAIPLNIPLPMLPVCAVIASTWGYVCYLVLYLMQGRWAEYLPTISETGVEEFGIKVQSRSFPGFCFMCAFPDICTAMYCATFGKTTCAIKTPFILLSIGMAGMFGLSFADLKDHLWMHRVCAFIGLSFLIAFESTSCRIAIAGMSNWGKITRVATQIAAWIFFVIAAFAEGIFSVRTCITWSTWGEYACLASMDAYLLSYFNAFQACRIILLCDV
jgi:hypothetical protein